MAASKDFKLKHIGELSKGRFHQDNASVQTPVIVMAATNKCEFNQIQYQLYSPSLAPSDSHLFQNLRKSISGHSDDNVILAEYFLDHQHKQHSTLLEEVWR